MVGQFEEEGTWPQEPDHDSRLVIRWAGMCAGANLGSRRRKATLVWLQPQLVLGDFHRGLLFLCFLGVWEPRSSAAGLACSARSGTSSRLETKGSPRSVITGTPQHLKTPSGFLLCSKFLPSLTKKNHLWLLSFLKSGRELLTIYFLKFWHYSFKYF